jgi:hypothetical protein
MNLEIYRPIDIYYTVYLCQADPIKSAELGTKSPRALALSVFFVAFWCLSFQFYSNSTLIAFSLSI